MEETNTLSQATPVKDQETGKSQGPEKDLKSNESTKKKGKVIIINDASGKKKVINTPAKATKKKTAGRTSAKKVQEPNVKIIPLGGLGEIGKNMTVIETDNDIIIIDCGMGFPDENQLGVDIIIPDTTYLDDKFSKIRALIITHGHEDHIGAVPYFLKKFPKVKVVGTALTLGILEHKLNEHKIRANLMKVKAGETYEFGCFKVEFVKVNHSIAGSVALAIDSPMGKLFHTGDFKVDLTPTHGDVINLSRFAELGDEGIKLLMCDSTNAERPGSTSSERAVQMQLLDLFSRHKEQRIIAATFASNMYRIQSLVKAAVTNGRKVCFNGRSMLRISETAIELGYIDIPEGWLVDIEEVADIDDDKICIITTGSQGEPMSALYRMAYDEHKQVTLNKNDLVVLSSHTIPGNEGLVNDIINRLIEKEVEIAYDDNTKNIHASGHACREELKMIHALLKPEFFMPMHGEIRHLHANKQIGEEMGCSPENILVTRIGRIVKLHHDTALDKDILEEIGSAPSGDVFIDGNGIGDVGSVVIKDRQIMASDGIVIIAMKMDRKTRQLIGSPDIVSRGFVFVKESDELIDRIRATAYREAKMCSEQGVSEWKDVKGKVKDAVSKFIYNKTKRNPMILPIIVTV